MAYSSASSNEVTSDASAKAMCAVCFDGSTTQIDQSLPPPCNQFICDDASVCTPCLQKILASSTLFKAPICPTCGSNMNSKDVKDTILLRRYKLVKQNSQLPDSELGATDLRERQAFARGSELEREVKELVETRGDLVKMSSIREAFMKQGSQNSTDNSNGDAPMKFPADESFFQNCSDYAKMTDEEKCYVSNLLTSGDANQLAQAAQILMSISNMHKLGKDSPQKRTNSIPPSEKETMAIRALAISDKNPKERHKLQKLEKLRSQHPLPKHMPKCISLKAKEFGDPFDKRASLLRFKNDDDHPSEGRVFVKLARGKADKLHILKGDVVTHFNGEVFHGTKDDLQNLIRRIQNDCGCSNKNSEKEKKEEEDASGEFTMSFNADENTAQVLREREIRLITQAIGLLEV